MFPDIADKMLLFFKLTNGRGFLHSLMGVFFCFIILFIISKGNKPISVPFLIGFVLHLILDLPYIPIFYPFIMHDFSYQGDPDWIRTLLTSLIVQITEIIGVSILSIIIIKNKLFVRDELREFLIPKPKVVSLKLSKTEKILVED